MSSGMPPVRSPVKTPFLMLHRLLLPAALLLLTPGLHAADPNTWTADLARPDAVSHTAGAAVSDVLYTVGGLNGSSAVNVVEAYDSVNETWSVVASAPQALCDHVAVESGNKVYAIGGRNSSGGSAVATNFVYDPVQNSWQTVGAMPGGRALAAAESMNGVIYVAGGESAGTVRSSLFAYTTLTNSWSTLTSMPTARRGAVMAKVGSKLYVIGGDTGSGALGKVEVYETSNDTWSTATSMPAGRTGAGCVVMNGIIYVVGGRTNTGAASNTLFAYDPSTDQWMSVNTPMPFVSSGFACGKVSGDLQVVGGSDGTNDLSLSAHYKAGALHFNVINSGAAVPSAPAGAVFESFGSPAINAKGHYAFKAKLKAGVGVSSTTNLGIWADQHGITLNLVAQSGTAAPGVTGAIFASFGDPVLNNDNEVAFRGTMTVGFGNVTTANHIGLWSDSPGALSLIMRIGDPAPDAAGTHFANLLAFALPDSGGPVFVATLAGTGVSSSNNMGIWSTSSKGNVHLVLRKGAQVLVNGKNRTVTGFKLLPPLALVSGQTRSFSPEGDITYRATFSDGTSAILHSIAP